MLWGLVPQTLVKLLSVCGGAIHTSISCTNVCGGYGVYGDGGGIDPGVAMMDGRWGSRTWGEMKHAATDGPATACVPV